MPEREDIDLFAALGRHADVGLDEPSAQLKIERRVDARLAARRASRRRRIRAWIAGHTAAVVAIGAVSVAGAGATAAVVLQGTPSHPARGVIPRVPGEHRIRERTYSIEMTPQLTVGEVGWCSVMATRYDDGQFGGSGAGCGQTANDRRHVHAGGTMYLGRGRGLIAYAIVDRTVAYAITATKPPRRLVPAADPGLPNGWRVIVQLPGESHTGNLRFRTSEGRRISTKLGPGDFTTPQRAAGSEGAPPDDAPCSIALPGTAVPRGSRWITEFIERDHLPGRALLPCTLTRFKLGDEWAEAIVLVDAARPAVDAAMDLPASRPSRLPNRVDFAPIVMRGLDRNTGLPRMPEGIAFDADATATRVGKGWLVVRAARPLLRDRLLDQLRVEIREP